MLVLAPQCWATQATNDEITITQIDIFYANPAKTTSVGGINATAVMNPTEGHAGSLGLSPKKYYIPDGISTSIRVHANYKLGDGRGSGSTYWDIPSSSISGTSITGNIYITVYFTYNYTLDFYNATSAVISARTFN